MDRIYINNDWRFHEQFQESDLHELMSDGICVRIPHTVKETPFHYFDEQEYQMLSCYQRMIFGEAAWEGKRVFLTFEAAAHEARVYLNGDLLGIHRNGYTAFTVELSSHLRYGEENLLTVQLDSRETLNQPPFGFVIDYMTYGGIYRDVYLEVKHSARLKDVFYKPSLGVVPSGQMSVSQLKRLRLPGNLETEIKLSNAAQQAFADGTLQVNQYYDSPYISEDTYRAYRDLYLKPVDGLPGVYETSVSFPSVQVWDVEHPALYKVRTELLISGEVCDSFEAEIGFRNIEFKEDGFYLNGRKLLIHGINRHQSFAYVGYAMPESMQREDARILKQELGVNTVRTSHYPQSHYFLEECDRLGLLVVTEIPGWQHIGDDAWKQITQTNVREMVTQYRNHPSIILWGVRINESKDDDAFYEKTNKLCRALDPTRPTGGVRCRMAGKHTNIQEDVFTYNDFVHSGNNPGATPKKKAMAGSRKPYLVTEYNGHMFPTKNYDCEEHRVEHMLRHANVMNAVAKEGNIAGCIGWCMVDYNTHKDFGSGDRICYHGVMDMFRNPKPAAWIHAAQGREDLVLEVASSMDVGEHPACNRGDIYIITNADAVRMYKNGRLIKQYTAKDSAWKGLSHGPILIDDYIGDAIREGEKFNSRKAELLKNSLNAYCLSGGKLNGKVLRYALPLMAFHGMNMAEANPLYEKYIGDWGSASKTYTFKAVKWGEAGKKTTAQKQKPDPEKTTVQKQKPDQKKMIAQKKMLNKRPVTSVKLRTVLSSDILKENTTYDVAALRIQAVDQDGNVLPFCQEPIRVQVEGPIQLIGPDMIPLQGGMGGLYVRSTGLDGTGIIRLSNPQLGQTVVTIKCQCK